MAWHVQSITGSLEGTRFQCKSCGNRATYQLFNTYDVPFGYYCKNCARIEVKDRNKYYSILTRFWRWLAS